MSARTLDKGTAVAAQHPTREAWLNAVASRMAPWYADLGFPLPKYRASIGFTSKGRKSKRIGECWSGVCSADGAFEIFIVPSQIEPSRVAGILAHELVHAAVGLEAKHGKLFKRVALAIGLEGKMMATSEGPKFLEAVKPILDAVGPFPHARLGDDPLKLTSTPKEQTNRHLKCVCGECGYTARTTAMWLRKAGAPICPTHNVAMSAPDYDELENEGGEE